MTKIREYAKAVAALLGSVATFLVTVNAPAEWSVYLGGVVAILTGVATFGIPNASKPVDVPAPVDAAIDSIQQTVQAATDAASVAVAAASDVDKLRQAATSVLGSVPVLGPLATQVINSLPKI